MNEEMLKLNKQIIFSTRASKEARMAAVKEIWEAVKDQFTDQYIKAVDENHHEYYKYSIMESNVMTYLWKNRDIDKGYNSHDDLRTEDDLHQQEVGYANRLGQP